MIDRDETIQSSGHDEVCTAGNTCLGGGNAVDPGPRLSNRLHLGFRRLPRFWYQNDSLWWLVGLAGVGAGSWLLGRAEQKDDPRRGWKPTTPGQRFQQLVLYTREECKLCDEAERTHPGLSPLAPPRDVSGQYRYRSKSGRSIRHLRSRGGIGWEGSL